MPSVELRVPPDPVYVGLARLVVALAARQAGLAHDRVQDVKIAVDEAVANAVRAQLAAEKPEPIDIVFGATEAGFEVVVHSREVPASAEKGAAYGDLAVDLVDPKLSFTLIEGLTDHVSYEQDGDRTHLRFVVAFE